MDTIAPTISSIGTPTQQNYSETESYSVDNKHDLEVVRKKMKYDKLVDLYV